MDYRDPPCGYVVVEGTVEITDDLDEVCRVAAITGGRHMGEAEAEESGDRNGVMGLAGSTR